MIPTDPSADNAPRLPVQGQDALLVFHVARSDRPDEDQDVNVDYRSLSPFQQISKGTLIVEKILAQPGVAGLDENGNSIAAEPGKDVDFKINNNIFEETEDDRIFYRAAIDGVLTFGSYEAQLVDVLELDNVNASTGNITTDQNVIIKGDISMGFHVTCSGNLYVKGSIENACHIECHGDLEVEKGILGERTEVDVKGSARVGYIQNSNITVNQNLIVSKYIFDSRVVCRQTVTVEGQTVRGSDRGSVVGGCINSVNAMMLHSVGSETNRTHLICGFDALKFASEFELEELINALNKKAVALEQRTGLDLNAADVTQQISLLSAEKKKHCRVILIELKSVMSKRDEATKQIELLQLQNTQSNPNATIKVERHQRGVVVVELCTDTCVFDNPSQGVTYSLSSDKIVASKI